MTARRRKLVALYAAILAAVVLVAIDPAFFWAGVVIGAVLWAAVATDQRNDASHAVDEAHKQVIESASIALRAKERINELEDENARLHVELTEAQIANGVIIPFPRTPIHDDLAVEQLRAELNDEWFTRMHGWGDEVEGS